MGTYRTSALNAAPFNSTRLSFSNYVRELMLCMHLENSLDFHRLFFTISSFLFIYCIQYANVCIKSTLIP